MATKILITPKNSIWGVIVNPQSSNTYRHALSFDTLALKKAFIDKELCEGKDYKALLAAQKETSFTRMTPTSGVFTIHPEQYPDETFFTLLNKDFCIIEEDGVEQFFTLTGTRDPDGGNTIVFTAELDIFFTYDVKDGMFNDQETEINRSMFDRYIKSGDKIVPRNNYQDTPLVNKESFDSDFSNILFPTSISKNIIPKSKVTWDWSKITDVTSPMPQHEKDFFEEQFLRLKWEIVTMVSDKTFSKLTPNKFIYQDNGSEVNTIATSFKNQNQPIHFPFTNFVSFISTNGGTVPYFTDRSPDGILYGYRLVHGDSASPFSSFEKIFLEDPTILKNSLQVLATSPLSIFDNITLTPEGVWSPLLGGDFRVKINDPSPNDNWQIFSTPSAGYSDPTMSLIGIKDIKLNQEETDLNIKIHNDNISLDPSKIKEISLEPKLDLSPYRIFQIGSSTKNKSHIKPELFTKNELKIVINNSYLTTSWGYQIDIKNYGNINNLNTQFLPSSRNYIVEDFANYAIATDKNQQQEFMVRNRAQQNAGFLNKGLGLGIGVLGALTSPLGGGLGVLGLASVAANSAAGINSQIAQRKDIKNSPNEIQNNGSTFEFDFITKSITPYIQELKLEPIILKQIWDHIYKYGYSINGEIKNINSILKTRYWFNYVEASKTYENIALQVSDQIKQLINDTLENGLTIWHIRDLNTFKGIKNYENENVEMSLITTVNDEEVNNA